MAVIFPPEGMGRDPAGLPERAPFAQLEPETLHRLREICEVRGFGAGQPVMAAGERADFVGFVQSGVLRVQKALPGYRWHIVGLLMEGDMFGRMFDGMTPSAIDAATDSRAICFERAGFEDLILQAPDLERLVVTEFLNEIDRARDWMIVLGNPRVRGKIAGFLIMLCTRFRRHSGLPAESGGDLSVRIPITRRDIANLLGTRPESISRALHALQDEGIIEIVQPDLITVRNPMLLADRAGGAALAGFTRPSQLPESQQWGQRRTR